MIVDLHVHAPPRGATAAAFAARAPALGLDAMALVGDDSFAHLDARELEGVRFFAGAELSTDRGHYLVFLPEPASLPSLETLFGARVDGVWPVRDVLARTKALGGATVAAHPYDRSIPNPGGDVLFTLAHLSAVEAVNPRHPPAFSYASVEAADTLGLPCVGGSGARTADELGTAATLFPLTIADEAGLVEALRAGACWPMEFGRPPEHLLRRGPSPHVPRDSSRPRRPR